MNDRRHKKIIRRYPGRFAKDFRQRHGGRGAFQVECEEQGFVPRVEPEVSRTAEESLVRTRRMYADDVPVQLATTTIPAAFANIAGLDQQDTGIGGIKSRMEDAGVEQTRMTESIKFRRMKPEENEFFKSDGPWLPLVMVLTHKAFAGEILVETTTCVMDLDWYVLEHE